MPRDLAVTAPFTVAISRDLDAVPLADRLTERRDVRSIDPPIDIPAGRRL